MTSDTLLYRMVSPSFMKDGNPTSQVFKPTRKDNGLLSVYDGDQISPQDAYEHFISFGNKAVGVLAVTVAECESLDLAVIPDPAPFAEHALIDFSALSRGMIRYAADELRVIANARGWQYRPNP